MKRVTILLCCMLLMTASFACSSGARTLRREGVLRVATIDCYAPFSYLGDDGELTGIDVEIARQVAADMGVSIEFVVLTFPEVLTAVKSGDADMGIAGITIDAARLTEYTFSDPYFMTGLRALAGVNVRDNTKISDCYVSVGIDTMAHKYVMANKSISFLPVVQEYQAVEELLAGNVDAALVDEASGKRYVAANEGKIKLLPGFISEYNYGVIVKLGNKALAGEINKTLRNMNDSGEMAELQSGYLD